MRLSPSTTPVSVVLPAYNAERFLAEAVESILAQTDPRFELLLVDDGSTDDTREIALGYAARDDRVQVLTGPHDGISAAINLGMDHARGEWVALMHADDVSLPDRLDRQRTAAEADPDVVLWATYAYHTNEAGDRLSLSESGPSSREICAARRRAGALIGNVIASTVFFRAADARAVGGFDPQFKTAEDLEFFERLAQRGPVVAIPEPLHERRLHAGAHTMRTFAEMKRMTRFAMARRRAWSEGRDAPTLDAFLRDYRQRSRRVRLGHWIEDQSQYLYHTAGLDYGSGRTLSALAKFAQAAAIRPGYAIPRAWRQLAGASQSVLDEPAVPFQVPGDGLATPAEAVELDLSVSA